VNLVIEQLEGPQEIEVKRFHVPAVVRSICPHCGYGDSRDLFRSEYLSYPTANEPFNMSFEHELDEGKEDEHATKWGTHVWTERVILKVSLEPAKEPA
jgi:hypothetical protein